MAIIKLIDVSHRMVTEECQRLPGVGKRVCQQAANKILELLLVAPAQKLQSTPRYRLFAIGGFYH